MFDDLNIEDFFKGLGSVALIKKYPSFSKYPQTVRECLEINEKIQALGTP